MASPLAVNTDLAAKAGALGGLGLPRGLVLRDKEIQAPRGEEHAGKHEQHHRTPDPTHLLPAPASHANVSTPSFHRVSRAADWSFNDQS